MSNPNLNPDLQNLLYMLGGNANQDIGYSSGQQYAQSIAGGENVPGMIAPGVSYSAASPQGYNQADLDRQRYRQRLFDNFTGIMPPAPTKGNPLKASYETMPYAPVGTPNTLEPISSNRYTPMITNAESLKNLADLFNANLPNNMGVSFDPFIDGEPMAIDDLQPTLFDIPFTPTVEPVVEPIVENLPSVGSSPIDFSFNPFVDSPNVDPVVAALEAAAITESTPENPYNELSGNDLSSLFKLDDLQNNPTGPVDMPAEVFEDRMEDIMDYDDLQDIIRNKEVLTQIPAEDGVRNQYQVELDNYINESENKKETYLDTFPVGGAINLGIPNIFENVVAPAVIPGLGLVKEATQSFNSPPPPPSPSFTAPSSGGRSYNDNSRFLLR